MDEWQPIETYMDAPARRNVVLWNGVRVFLGWLSDEGGWSDATNQDRDDFPESPQPTHWMPLPAPPLTTT